MVRNHFKLFYTSIAGIIDSGDFLKNFFECNHYMPYKKRGMEAASP